MKRFGICNVFVAVSALVYASSAQTIASPTVAPSAITSGSPSLITVTALITSTGPTVLPSSVTLLQVDKTGNNAVILGSLNDNGTNGDAFAGDGLFGGQSQLSAATEGAVYLQVSAAFPGSLRRVTSPIVPLLVTAPGLNNSPRPPDISMTTTEPSLGNTVICNELLVTFQPGVISSTAASTISNIGASLIGILPALGIYQVGLPQCSLAALTNARATLLANPLVSTVDFDSLGALTQVSATPNDAYYQSGKQWGLAAINMPLGWNSALLLGTSRRATIGVIDSGIDAIHEDLAGNVTSGLAWCTNANCTAPTATGTATLDDYGHGTAVAGLAAAISNNFAGVASPAFTARLISEKITPPTNPNVIPIVGVANAIYDAISKGARVLNMSFKTTINGSPGLSCSQVLTRAVQYANERGVIIVASAGNDKTDLVQCPGGYSAVNANVIAVGASDQNDHRADFSNYGAWVTLYAPGTAMFILQYGHGAVAGTYGYWAGDQSQSFGTSFAAPLVTGTVSLMLGMRPQLTPGAVKTLLTCTADQIGFDPDGDQMLRLNAGKAVQYASLGYTSCPNPMTVSRSYHTATLLGNGLVLVTGGWSEQGFYCCGQNALSSAEICNPVTGVWRYTGLSQQTQMTTQRAGHTATRLADGRVLLVGGAHHLQYNSGVGGATTIVNSSAELFDPVDETFTPVSLMSDARQGHGAMLLTDGRVLVVGGNQSSTNGTAEIFDSTTGAWTLQNYQFQSGYGYGRTYLSVVALTGSLTGKILVTGGSFVNSVDLFDVGTNTWKSLAPMLEVRTMHTAHPLPNGKVLIVGGNNGGTASNTAELYDPSGSSGLGATAYVPGTVTVDGWLHGGVTLPNGNVFVAGGSDANGNTTANAQLYNYMNNSLTSELPIATSRTAFPMVWIPSVGHALLPGGLNVQNGMTIYLRESEIIVP